MGEERGGKEMEGRRRGEKLKEEQGAEVASKIAGFRKPRKTRSNDRERSRGREWKRLNSQGKRRGEARRDSERNFWFSHFVPHPFHKGELTPYHKA